MTCGTAERSRSAAGVSPPRSPWETALSTNSSLARIARHWLSARVREGEAKSVAAFSAYAFLLLVCYYIFKTLREPLLLQGGSAEQKSYAYAVIALLFLFLVPIYSVAFRHTRRRQLIRWVTAFFAFDLVVFQMLGRAGFDVGFFYYVWVGVFGLFMLAQFWAHAAYVYSVSRGQRLIPLIMIGAAAGGLVGPLVCDLLFAALGPWQLMLLGTLLLLGTLPIIDAMGPLECEVVKDPQRAASGLERESLLGGLGLVFRDRYLTLLALLAVLLNCINTTGEYMLADLVVRHAAEQVALDPGLRADVVIGDIYASFFFWVNLLTLFLQIAVVDRVLRRIGVQGALLVLPVIAAVGYGLFAFVPVFSIIRAVKIFENSADYSLMNTLRHVLYLPLPVEHKYQGKTAVDTFFWRLGDVAQAGIVYAGLHLFGFGFQQFALLNLVLAGLWLIVAHSIGRRYAERTESAPVWRHRPLRVGAFATSLVCLAMALPAVRPNTLNRHFDGQDDRHKYQKRQIDLQLPHGKSGCCDTRIKQSQHHDRNPTENQPNFLPGGLE